MAKKAYIGVGSTAKKGKKFYIGINGVAKKVKKMYIGVGGYSLGDPVVISTDSNQTGSITGTKTLPFSTANGIQSLGATTSYTLASLYSSKEIIYTDATNTYITCKKVTDSETVAGVYAEGTETTGTAVTGQTAAIVGSTTYTFNSSTGQYTLGSTSSNALSTLYSNETKLYTDDGSTLSSKKVTAKTTAYIEGSATSSSTTSTSNGSISGYTSYSFNSSNGQYSSVGSSTSKSYDNMHSSKITLYTEFGNNLTYKQVTNKSTTGGYTRWSYEWSDPSSYTTMGDVSYDGCTSYSFDSLTGEFSEGGMYMSGSTWEGTPFNYTLYSPNGKSCSYTSISFSGDYPIYIETGYTTAYSYETPGTTNYTITTFKQGSSSGTTYTVTPYTKGTNYTEGSTTYTVETSTRTASSTSSNIAKLIYIAGYKFGTARQTASANGQTSAINGTFTVPTIDENGQIVFGATSSQSLSTIYNRSDRTIYTGVDSAKDTLTYKTVTSPTTYYTEGSESTSTASGQSGSTSIEYYPSYSFNSSTGQYTLTGTKSTTKISSLGVNTSKKLYTSGGTSLVYKKITNSSTSSPYYSEGSETSSSTTSTSDNSISGYTSYSFSSSTGQYSSSGSSTSKSYSSMYSAGTGTTLYTSFGSSLTYKKVTNKSESTGTVYKEGSFSYSTFWSVEPDDSFDGYGSYSFDSSKGYIGRNWTSETLWAGNSWFSLYSISNNGKTIYRDDYSYSDYGFGISCTCSRYTATATTSTGTITTYTITTYTKGSTYNAGSTTYSIATTTKGRNSGTSYTVTTYEKDVVEGD